MLGGAKEGLGWGLGGYGVANYSRGETPICPKLLMSLERATEKKHCQRHNGPED